MLRPFNTYGPRQSARAIIPTIILQFLDGSGGNRPYLYFDLDYALRVCIQNGQHLACVRIYSMMNLPDQAVSLALKCGDIELAKQHADVPDEDEMKFKPKFTGKKCV